MLDEEGGDLRDILRQNHILAGQIGPRNTHHVGKHAAGADKVDADILTVDLAGERLREPGQRVLGGGVGALQRIALVRDDGGDVENGRALRAAEQRQREMAGKIGNASIERHDAVELRHGGLLEGTRKRDSGVVDQNIQPAEALLYGCKAILQIGVVQKVAGEQQCFHAVFPDRSGRRRELFFAPSKQRERNAILREAACNAGADPAAGAGDECDFSFQNLHTISPAFSGEFVGR